MTPAVRRLAVLLFRTFDAEADEVGDRSWDDALPEERETCERQARAVLALLRPMIEVVADALGWYYARWDMEASKALNRSVAALPDFVVKGLCLAAMEAEGGALASSSAAPAEPESLDRGVWFQSAVSGLHYRERDAAGGVRSVRIDGVEYAPPAPAPSPVDAPEVMEPDGPPTTIQRLASEQTEWSRHVAPPSPVEVAREAFTKAAREFAAILDHRDRVYGSLDGPVFVGAYRALLAAEAEADAKGGA